ncbi:MAG: CPBP family intramembrane glutamic endopeptidase [Bauldia sp.]
MFVLTWPLELGLAAQSHGLLSFYFPPVIELFVGYGFVAAAIIMSGLVDGWAGIVGLLKRLLIWRVGWIWYAVALLGPAAFYLLGIGIHVVLGGAIPDFGQPFIVRLVPPSFNIGLAAVAFFLYQVFVNGEEFGWRGYALPRLQARQTALVASLIIGVVWAFWHVPKYLTAGDPHDLPFWFFAITMIANAILYTWVFNKTRGSLLLMLLLHAGVNTGVVMLPIMPVVVGDTRPLVIAYGLQIVAAVAVVLFAGMNLGRTPEAQRTRPTASATS